MPDSLEKLDLLLFVHPLEGGLDADDPLAPVLGNVLQFTFRTTMTVERIVDTSIAEEAVKQLGPYRPRGN